MFIWGKLSTDLCQLVFLPTPSTSFEPGRHPESPQTTCLVMWQLSPNCIEGVIVAGIKVTYGEIETAATTLGAGRETITQNFRDMQSQINGLVQSGFVTELASEKFNNAYNTYTTSANTCVDKLTEIQTFLTQTATAMREMDQQIANKIN